MPFLWEFVALIKILEIIMIFKKKILGKSGRTVKNIKELLGCNSNYKKTINYRLM